MLVVQLPTGLLKLALTGSKNRTSLPDPPAREPRHLHDVREVSRQPVHAKQGKIQKDYSNTLKAKGVRGGGKIIICHPQNILRRCRGSYRGDFAILPLRLHPSPSEREDEREEGAHRPPSLPSRHHRLASAGHRLSPVSIPLPLYAV